MKRIISLFLVSVMLVLLCSCKKQQSNFSEELKKTPPVYTEVRQAPLVNLSEDEMFSYINQMEDLINRIATSGCDDSTVTSLAQTGEILRSYRYEEETLPSLTGTCGDMIRKILNLKNRIYAIDEIYSLYDTYNTLADDIPEKYTEGFKRLSRRTLNMAMLAAYLSGQADYDQSSVTFAGGISFTTRGGGTTFDRIWASIGKFAGYPLQNMQPVFFSDTYTVVACNTVITDNKLKEENKNFNRATSEYVEIFKDQSINCVATETPHMYDFGTEGKSQTEGLFTNNGLNALSSGVVFDAINFEQDASIRISAYDFTNKMEDPEALMGMQNLISACKTDGKLLALYIAWDTANGVTQAHKVLAHTLLNSGADIIIGLSDGDIQGIERVNGKYIFYNIGQLVNGNNATLTTDKSLAIRAVVDKQGTQSTLASVTVIPFYQSSSGKDANNFQPIPIFEDELTSTINDILKKSEAFEDGIDEIDYFNPAG